MNKMLSALIGLVMLGYAGYQYNHWYTTPEFTPDVVFLVKSIGGALLGVIGLAIPGYDYVKWFKMPGFNFKAADKDARMSPKMIEKHDFDCLVHLRNRVIESGDEEGIKLISELNSVIFNIHTRNKTIKG